MPNRPAPPPQLQGNIGDALRRIRLLAGKTLRDVERETGVSNAYLSQLENGSTKNPSPQILFKLSASLGVPYESLMELAGHLRPTANAKQHPSAIQAALMSAKLNPEEEARVAEFIAFLRAQRRKK
jgi:transcriptional regulator with XRE-family HTH domain